VAEGVHMQNMEHLPARFCHENAQPHANELQHVVAHTAVATVRL